jgi:hypothetical protein
MPSRIRLVARTLTGFIIYCVYTGTALASNAAGLLAIEFSHHTVASTAFSMPLVTAPRPTEEPRAKLSV